MTSTPSDSTATTAEAITFVDTNVLIYAYNAADPAKQRATQAALVSLWDARIGAVSTQILQEFYSVATTKLRPAMSHDEAREVVSLYTAWPVVLIEPSLILTASRLVERHKLSFWDALMVEAARTAGASRLLTEDLNHGQVIEGVRIESPFSPDWSAEPL